MSLLSFLASAAGGTLLGGFTQLLSIFAGEAKEWSASKRRIAELQAAKERDIAIGELDAFKKAQDGAIGSNYQPPAAAPMGMHWVFTVVEAITRLVRPMMVLGACWYIWTLPPATLGALQNEIVAFCFACGYFWLGIRFQKQMYGTK